MRHGAVAACLRNHRLVWYCGGLNVTASITDSMSSNDKHANALPEGTRLDGTEKGQYEILGVLGVGGFGITYKARDNLLQSIVAIKEYLPADFALRNSDGSTVIPRSSNYSEQFNWGLNSFLEEARTLKRFREHHIVRVESFLQANGTAYMVMEFEEGQPLDVMLKENPTLTEAQLKQIFVPILQGLRAVHAQQFLHRDIKPGNIFLRQRGGPVLLDFGAARQALVEQSRSITGILTAGYAPFEQYSNARVLTPAADLYALGATIYRCIAGKKPVEAPERVAALHNGEADPFVPAVVAGAGRFSARFLQAIDWCLQPLAKDRPQNADELLAVLEDSSGAPADVSDATVVVQGNSANLSTRMQADLSRNVTKIASAPLTATQQASAAVTLQAPVASRAIGKYVVIGLLALVVLVSVPLFGLYWRESRALQAAVDAYEGNAFSSAYDQFVALAERENPVAQFYLGKIHRFGIGRPVNREQAQKWFDLAIANGIVKRLLSAAEGGDAAMQSDLGTLYFEGIGVEKNPAKAAHWYEQAAQQGHPVGQTNFATQLLHGLGVGQDASAAAQWYEKAAQQNYAQAQYALANLYATGNGVTQDYTQALQWYEKAAENDLPAAHTGLALLYQNGQGVQQNLAKALEYFRVAADAGDTAAQRGIANLYALGAGVEKDPFKALEWYEKAASQGDNVAQNELGYFYGTGDGIPKDYEKSLYWYRKAAEQNNATAQFNLGVMYETGAGVARSLSDATVWYQKAARNKHPQAKAALNRLINPSQ